MDGLWKPTKAGLGMGHVFDVLNGLYGDGASEGAYWTPDKTKREVRKIEKIITED